MEKTTKGIKNKRIEKSKRNLIIAIIAIMAIGGGIGGYMTTSASTDENQSNDNNAYQNVLGKWMDIHGVGIFSLGKDDSLYLATHNGLFKKDKGNLSSWMQVGTDKSDLMGFTINPNREGVMYSSGHPSSGGNLGFRKSIDSGITWQKVSDVTNPPIDFHSMTMGNNPEIIYAASGRGDSIYITHDEGKTWTKVSPPNGERVMTLAANQTASSTIYASTDSGLFSSIDQGKNWQKVEDNLIGNDVVVTGLGLSSNGKTVYAFVIPSQNEEGYIIKSNDGAKTWSKVSEQINEVQYIGKFAFGKNGEVYATVIQETNDGVASSVYRSNDEGKTWVLEGTNSKSTADSML